MSTWPTLAVLTLLLAAPVAGCLSLGGAEDEPRPDRAMAWTQPGAWDSLPPPGEIPSPTDRDPTKSLSVEHHPPQDGFEVQNTTLDELAGPGNWSVRSIQHTFGEPTLPPHPGEEPAPQAPGGRISLSASGDLQATFNAPTPRTMVVETFKGLVGPLAPDEAALQAWTERFLATELPHDRGQYDRIHYAVILPGQLNVTPLLDELAPTPEPDQARGAGYLRWVADRQEAQTTFSISLAIKQALREVPGQHLDIVVDPLDRLRVHQEGVHEDPPLSRAQASSDLARALTALGVQTHVLEHGEVWETASSSLWPDQPAQAPPRHP